MKWQYKTVICANNYELDRELNKLGEKGWEAYNTIAVQYPAGYYSFIAYLKRCKNK